MMAKFNVGDKVRVTVTHEDIPYGTELTVKEGPAGPASGGNYRFLGRSEVVLGDHLELVTPIKPKKSARITALETQVATLQAKVEALESAGKFPLTERFERESSESNCEAVDGILADIERKAKPTLEALLATYSSTANERRANVIKRAEAFVSKEIFRLFSNQNVEFVVNVEKRTVVALLHRKFLSQTEIVRKGIAKCDPDDVFNADIGKAIALARALGVEVPVEFVKAVQPTACVWQRIKLKHCGFITLEPRDVAEIDAQIGRKIAWITDDTDAVYS